MRGVFTALITPFDDQGKLDLDSFEKILLDQKSAGITGVVACGTTGESPTLSTDEKKSLILAAIETLKGSGVKVIAGTGSNDTRHTVEFSAWASDAGVDAVLVVTPYYNKPSQAAMGRHFREVADAVDCEVIPYNVPGRTGVSLTAATMAALARHPKMRSLKEATGNVALTSEVLDLLGEGVSLDILSGDDATYLPLLSIGATGVISVASNLFPRAMVSIQRAFEGGRIEEAQALHRRFFPLFRDLFIDANPVPIKYAMSRQGMGANVLRSPLIPLSDTDAQRLDRSLERCGFNSRGGTL